MYCMVEYDQSKVPSIHYIRNVNGQIHLWTGLSVFKRNQKKIILYNFIYVYAKVIGVK